jgi:uncharacterized repeat protein (TIGR01451 family)
MGAHRYTLRIRRAFSILTAALLVGAALVWVAGPAQAASPCPIPANFEIDGDMSEQTCDPGKDDWNTSGIGVQSTTQGGTYSTAGKDDGNPSTWVSSGSTPDKTNFERAYATSRIAKVGGVDHFFVFVAWERTNTSGTQGYAIEIDNSGSNVGADGTPQPNRSSGGAVFYISSQGSSAPAFDSACTFTSQSNYGTTCTSSSGGVTAAINTAQFTDPLANTSQAAGSFFEVALDVTFYTGITPSCPGAAANSVYLRSITGQTHNGNLKGYMAPLDVAPASTCVAPTIVTTATPGNSTIDGLQVTTSGSAQYDVATVNGSGGPGVGTVKFYLCQPDEVTAGGCEGTAGDLVSTETLDSNGDATSDTVDDSTTPNDSANGTYCWRAEFTPGANDHHYLAAKHTNHSTECFKVAHATPSIATESSFDTTSGAAAHSVGFTTLGDTATLSNVYSGASLTGQKITFRLYGPLGSTPGANDCTPGALVYGPVDGSLTKVDDTTWHASAPTYTPTASDGPGYYTWVASYAGDQINDPDTGACGDANETQHLVGPLLQVAKGTPHGTITAGEDVVYDINLANVGEGTASGVVVTDVLPILAGGGTWTLDPTSGYNCSIADGTGANLGHQVVTCDVGDLDPSSSTQIAEVSATTTPADCGDINNSAVLEADPDVSQTAGPVTVHVQCPSLAIVKDADAPSVNVGSPIGFTVTATNNGQGTATGVLVNDPLPTGPGITWTIDPDPLKTHGPLSCSITAGTLSCTGSLAAGASQVVHVTSPTQWTGTGETEVNSCLGGTDQTGVYDNTAQVSASNVTDSPSDSAQEQVLCPDLSLSKTADAAAVNAGTSIGFVVTASNSGQGDATGALVNDPLPTGVTWTIDVAHTSGPLSCSITAGTLSCTGTLAAGETEIVHITAPTSFAQCGTYDNTATLTTTNAPSPPDASDSTEVLCADVVVEKAPDAESVSVGEDIGFTVTVTNNGDGQATGVEVNDLLPAGQGVSWSVLSSTGPLTCSITGTPPNQTLTCTGNLAASGSEGDSQVVHVTSGTVRNANLNSCGVYDNTATLTWLNGPLSTISSNEATEAVLCPALTFVKTADHATVNAGAQIGFTVKVSNSAAEGTGTATGVAIDDPLPSGSGVNWSIASGPSNCSIVGAPPSETLHCTAVTLEPGDSESVHVVSGTSTASCKVYRNVASLSATNSPALTATASTGVANCVIVSPPEAEPPSALPNTGAPFTKAVLGLDILVLAAGGFLVWFGRRRKDAMIAG